MCPWERRALRAWGEWWGGGRILHLTKWNAIQVAYFREASSPELLWLSTSPFPLAFQAPLPAVLLAVRCITVFSGPYKSQPCPNSWAGALYTAQPHSPQHFVTSLFSRLSSSVRSEVKQQKTCQLNGWERHLAVYEKYSITIWRKMLGCICQHPGSIDLLQPQRGSLRQASWLVCGSNNVYPLWLCGKRLWKNLDPLMPGRLAHSDSFN